MTLQTVARIAGVSPSTVSRVVHNHPRVSDETIAAVSKAMAQVNYLPRRWAHRNGHGVNGKPIHAAHILFVIFGASGLQAVSAFEHLLRGVSSAASEREASISIHFVTKPDEMPANLFSRRVDGLLLHGEMPGSDLQTRLESIPTVWLMANRRRPIWGDEVLPDNTFVGELAANYLLARGHKHLAVCNVKANSWTLQLRSRAFAWQTQAEGGRVTVLDESAEQAIELRPFDDMNRAASHLIDRFVALAPRPTGLFIVEDRQATPIYAALRSRGLSIGRDGDVEIISCNNERPHLLGLDPVPATIDIRAQTIGRRAVEHLMWRMDHWDPAERVRMMIEPLLVDPTNTHTSADI